MVIKEEIEKIDEQSRKEIDGEGLELKTVNKMIKEAVKETKMAVVSHCKHLNGLASGLRTGTIAIKGDGGDYVGTLNSGANITIEGSVGNFVADNMIGGKVVIQGNANFCTAPYCYGGLVFISGTSGDFLGTMNKGATIIVEKDVGDDVGTYMLAGNLVLLGNAGERLANSLIAGEIFIKGNWKSLGHNAKIENLAKHDLEFLQQLFSVSSIDAKAEDFAKIVPESNSPFYSKKN